MSGRERERKRKKDVREIAFSILASSSSESGREREKERERKTLGESSHSQYYNERERETKNASSSFTSSSFRPFSSHRTYHWQHVVLPCDNRSSMCSSAFRGSPGSANRAFMMMMMMMMMMTERERGVGFTKNALSNLIFSSTFFDPLKNEYYSKTSKRFQWVVCS